MDIRHLRHFVAVAEELHFGRAAQRLGMTQPPLSQSIQRLEASLGVTLFERGRRQVAMTAPGRTLLPYARDLVAQAELAERVVRRASVGEFDTLRVGVLSSILPRALPRTLLSYKKHWPGVQVQLAEHVSYKQVELLRRGRLDLGIIGPHVADTSGLAMAVVGHSRLMVAVPSAWPLAARLSVRLGELAALPFVGFPRRLAPYNDTILEACLRAGFSPNVVQETTQVSTQLNMVANEVGIALMGSWAAEMEPRGISFLAIDEAPASFDSDLAVVWDEARVTPPLAAFVETLKSICQARTEPPAAQVIGPSGT